MGNYLICADAHRSVLASASASASASRDCHWRYSPFGYAQAAAPLRTVLGFNGELREPVDSYLLGHGYRAYNPGLMRFNSPDSRSPMGEGGMNAYAYCHGDPVNATDPSGHKRLMRGKLFEIGTSGWMEGRVRMVADQARNRIESRALSPMRYNAQEVSNAWLAKSVIKRTRQVVAKVDEPRLIQTRNPAYLADQMETITMLRHLKRSEKAYLHLEGIASSTLSTPSVAMAKNMLREIWRKPIDQIELGYRRFTQSIIRDYLKHNTREVARIRSHSVSL